MGFHAVYAAKVQQKISTFGIVFTHFNMPLSITYLLFLWNAIATYTIEGICVCMASKYVSSPRGFWSSTLLVNNTSVKI